MLSEHNAALKYTAAEQRLDLALAYQYKGLGAGGIDRKAGAAASVMGLQVCVL